MEMDHPAHTEEDRSPWTTWGVIAGMAGAFLVYGLLVFFALGDKGPLEWDFSVIPDVPGESVYSTYSPFRPHGLVPGPYPAKIDPQHVMSPETEAQRMEIPKK